MTTNQRENFDPATLAASVRGIAMDASRFLKSSAREPVEIGALTNRISDLQFQARSCTTGDLSRWLESLSRQVNSNNMRIRLDDKVGVN